MALPPPVRTYILREPEGLKPIDPVERAAKIRALKDEYYAWQRGIQEGLPEHAYGRVPWAKPQTFGQAVETAQARRSWIAGLVSQESESTTKFALPAFEKIFSKRLAIGLGAAAVTGLAVWATTGAAARKEDHNTLIGMQYGGMAQDQRHQWTRFGSGWKGIFNKKGEEDVNAEFEYFTKSLEEYGKETGTGHKRILIPKSILSEQELEDKLGFQEVLLAIPEAGQTRVTSWRHPSMLYHLHEHGEFFTMHKDEHAASTMLIDTFKQKAETSKLSWWQRHITGPAKYFLQGLPHVITEGVPGLYYYLKGQATGATDMLMRLAQELPETYRKQLEKLEGKTEPLFQAARQQYSNVKGWINKQKSEEWSNALWNIKFIGLGFAAPAYAAARHRTPEQVMQQWYGRIGGRVVEWLPTASFLGIEATRAYYQQESFTSLTAGAIGMGASIAATKRFLAPLLEKVPHLGARQAVSQGTYFLGYMAGKAIYNMLSGENVAINPIEGLHPRGELSGDHNEAKNIIQKLTPFGSKVDRLKVLAKLLGKDLDEVLGAKAFHEALAGGTVVRQIGEESFFATTHVMKTTYMGHELEYVRKTIKPGFQATIQEHLGQVEQHAELMTWVKYNHLGQEEASRRARKVAVRARRMEESFLMRGANLEREASMMRAVGHEGLTPTAYHATPESLYMELAGTIEQPAITLREALSPESKTKITQQMVESLKSEVQHYTHARIVNPDLHPGNILIDPEKGSVFTIDLGLARRFPEEQVRLMEDKMMSRINQLEKHVSRMEVESQMVTRKQLKPKIESPVALQATIDKYALAETQRDTARAMFERGVSSGKMHDTAYARRIRRSRDPFSR